MQRERLRMATKRAQAITEMINHHEKVICEWDNEEQRRDEVLKTMRCAQSTLCVTWNKHFYSMFGVQMERTSVHFTQFTCGDLLRCRLTFDNKTQRLESTAFWPVDGWH